MNELKALLDVSFPIWIPMLIFVIAAGGKVVLIWREAYRV